MAQPVAVSVIGLSALKGPSPCSKACRDVVVYSGGSRISEKGGPAFFFFLFFFFLLFNRKGGGGNFAPKQQQETNHRRVLTVQVFIKHTLRNARKRGGVWGSSPRKILRKLVQNRAILNTSDRHFVQ